MGFSRITRELSTSKLKGFFGSISEPARARRRPVRMTSEGTLERYKREERLQKRHFLLKEGKDKKERVSLLYAETKQSQYQRDYRNPALM